jgi:hypothetical protein
LTSVSFIFIEFEEKTEIVAILIRKIENVNWNKKSLFRIHSQDELFIHEGIYALYNIIIHIIS